MRRTETQNNIAYWVGDVSYGQELRRTRVVPIGNDDLIGFHIAVEVEDKDALGNIIWVPYTEGNASNIRDFNNHAIAVAMFDWACQFGGKLMEKQPGYV